MVQGALALCHQKQKFLYEVIPEFLPYNNLTEVEMSLWGKWYQKMKEK